MHLVRLQCTCSFVCREVEAVSFNYLRREWNILDPALAEDFKQLEKVEDAEFSVVSETADQRTWIVTFSKDDGPSASYIYNRCGAVLRCAALPRRHLFNLECLLLLMHLC